MAKYAPYKMKGHTLPGIKQSPAKLAPLITALAPMIAGKLMDQKDSPGKQLTPHTGGSGSSYNVSEGGKKYTKFHSDPKSKSQKGYITEYSKMSSKDKVKKKINPKSNIFTSNKGDQVTIDTAKKA